MSDTAKPGEFVAVELKAGQTIAQHMLIETPRFPITMLALTDHTTGDNWRFDPQADITAYELALITNMAFKMTMNRAAGIPEWKPYLEEHKLARHFKPI